MDIRESLHTRATQGSDPDRGIVLISQRPACWRAVGSSHRAPRRLQIGTAIRGAAAAVVMPAPALTAVTGSPLCGSGRVRRDPRHQSPSRCWRATLPAVCSWLVFGGRRATHAPPMSVLSHRLRRTSLFMSAKSTEGESLSAFISRQQCEKTFVQYARRAPPASGQEHRNLLAFSGYVGQPFRGMPRNDYRSSSSLGSMNFATARANDGRRGRRGFCLGVAGVN